MRRGNAAPGSLAAIERRRRVTNAIAFTRCIRHVVIAGFVIALTFSRCLTHRSRYNPLPAADHSTHVKEDGSMMRDAAARKRPIDMPRATPRRLGLRPRSDPGRGPALEGLPTRLDDSFLRSGRADSRLPRRRDRHRHRQGRHDRPEAHRHVRLDRRRAHFLHPAEAFHGDLGRVHADDVVLALSQSGETSEVLQLLPAFKQFGVKMIADDREPTSTLGRAAAVVLPLGKLEEACSLGLAPSTSTTAMLALGDALALVVSRLRGFRAEDFARFHPGGALGLKLSAVDDHMRPLAECRVARANQAIREVLVTSTRPGRRSGAIMLVDDAGRLAGCLPTAIWPG